MIDKPAIARLEAWPRIRLAHLPTPLIRVDRLASGLGNPPVELFVKLDAETGFALGGNKVRKLEFELEPGRLEGITCLLSAGGPQSNHCRVTAAAAARLGLRCILVLNGPEPKNPTGNALLHRLFGAEIVTVEDRDERSGRLDSLAADLEAAGEGPMVVPIGASTGLGCLGYARAALELLDQADAVGPAARTVVFVPSSSCGTLAGLLLGISLMERTDVVLVGVSADATAAEIREETLRIAGEGAALLGFQGTILEACMIAEDRQVGGGYGISTEASHEAISHFGRLGGVVLDPTYTAKGAAELIAWAREGRFAPGDRIVFLHTGGAPGLLA